MSHPSNSASQAGLRAGDPAVIAHLYADFRSNLLHALIEKGCPPQMATFYLRTTILAAGRLANQGGLPTDLDIDVHLRTLALAVLQQDRGPALPAISPLPSVEADPLPDPAPPEAVENELVFESPAAWQPDDETIRYALQAARVWTSFRYVDHNCRYALMGGLVQNSEVKPELSDDCLQQVHEFLRKEAPASESNRETEVEAALQDKEGYRLWKITGDLEEKIRLGDPIGPAAIRRRKVNRAILGILGLLLAASGIWYWFLRSKTPAEVYESNFTPPKSIIADLETRLQAGSADSAFVFPPECLSLFEEADRSYRAGEYEAAAGPLTYLLDSAPAACQSDALYYLGIIGLHLERPGLTIECLSKIEDLDRFGEDIYWYQALAFVKMADTNPLIVDRARRAVERAVSNSRNEERRQQAEKMLQNLEN